MLRNALIFSILVLLAVSYPFLGEQFVPENPEQAAQAPSNGAPFVARLDPVDRQSATEVRLKSDGRGHFFGEFSINSRKLEAMVDTGASTVAINLSTARRAGLSLKPSDFTGTVSTAGGAVKAAYIVLDTVEIGRIRAKHVQAVVLEDKVLPTTLIGMTFLKQLSGFQSDGETLVLKR